MLRLIIFLCVVFYFLPSIIGFSRGKSNKGAIFALNLLLGWSVVGWIVAFVWAVSNQAVDKPAVTPAPAASTLCASCGKYNDPALRFCGHCGIALTSA